MGSENKKVINATEVYSNGIHFKSTLESRFYNYMVKQGFNPQYESQSFILWDGFYPQKPFYIDGQPYVTKRGYPKKLKDWVYTPDFIITLGHCTFIIEAKGQPNDVYSYKRKLFLKILDTMRYTYFFEVHSIKGLAKTLSKIKEIYEQENTSSNN